MGVVTRVFSMQTRNLIRIRDMSILWDFEKISTSCTTRSITFYTRCKLDVTLTMCPTVMVLLLVLHLQQRLETDAPTFLHPIHFLFQRRS